MMLPLEKRTNRLLAVLIRAINLEFSQYTLQIIASEGKSFYSRETECTMLPKFDLDRSSREMSKFLLSTDQTNMKFILLKSNPQQEKIYEFSVDMGDLLFLCKDMSKAKVKHYPIIIFEFIEGFYTTKELYMNNTYNYQLEPFNNLSNLSIGFSSISHYKNGNINLSASMGSFAVSGDPTGAKDKEKDNLFNSSNGSSAPLSAAPSSFTYNSTSKKVPKAYFNFSHQLQSAFNKREIKFSQLNEKIKQYEFFEKQLKIITSDKNEKIKQLSNKLQITNEALSRFYKKYQMMIDLNKSRKQALVLSEKIQTQQSTIENIKKIISQKHSDLHISTSIFFLNRENYKDKVEYIEKNYKKIEKYKIMYNAFKNKKLIEIAYFFLNKMCYKFYLLPPFYNQAFDSVNKIQRYQFYEKNTKELAVMMGNVANLISYLSKQFNIPLRYPMFVNGSRSFIVKDKKDFVALYSVPKNEDRNQKLEQAMDFLQDNLSEIMKYFHISEEECKGSPESDKHTVTGTKAKNIFSDFIKLSNFLKNLVTKNKLQEDLV